MKGIIVSQIDDANNDTALSFEVKSGEISMLSKRSRSTQKKKNKGMESLKFINYKLKNLMQVKVLCATL